GSMRTITGNLPRMTPGDRRRARFGFLVVVRSTMGRRHCAVHDATEARRNHAIVTTAFESCAILERPWLECRAAGRVLSVSDLRSGLALGFFALARAILLCWIRIDRSPSTRDCSSRRKLMARVVRFHQLGGPEVLRVEEVKVPPPGKGEVQINVKALGLNRAEAMFRKGQYLEEPRLPAPNAFEA